MQKVMVYASLAILLAGGLIAFAQPISADPGGFVERSSCDAKNYYVVFGLTATKACDDDSSTRWVAAIGTTSVFFRVNTTSAWFFTGVSILHDDTLPKTIDVEVYQGTSFIPVGAFVVPSTASNSAVNYVLAKPVYGSALIVTGNTQWGAFEIRPMGYGAAIVVPMAGSMTANPNYGLAPLNVSFKSTLTGGSFVYTYAWTFGDGSTSTSANPYHNYSVPGIYRVQVTITDSSVVPNSVKLEQEIRVIENPPAAVGSLNLLVLILLASLWIIGAFAGTILRTGFFVILGGISALAFAITAWNTTGELLSSTLLFAAAVLTLAWVPFMADREKPPG